MAKPSILEFESDRPSKKGEHTQRGTKEEIFFVSLFVFQLLHCNSLKICRCERSEAVLSGQRGGLLRRLWRLAMTERVGS